MHEHYAEHTAATYDGQDDPLMIGGQSSNVAADANEGYSFVEEQNEDDRWNTGPVGGW